MLPYIVHYPSFVKLPALKLTKITSFKKIVINQGKNMRT